MAVCSQKMSSFLKRAAVVAVGVAAVFAAGGARAEYSGDYVQDGLVAIWDGHENAGVLNHLSAPTKWVDLVRGVEIDLPEWVTVEDHSLCSTTFTSKASAPALASIEGLSTSDAAWTIEVVQQCASPWRDTQYNNLQTVFSTPRGSLGYRLNNTKGFYFFGPKSTTQCQLQNWTHATAQVTDVHTMSAKMGVSKATDSIWMDGVQDTVNFNDSYTAANPTAFKFFSNPNRDIRVYAIRVYNRALTQAEITANRAVDVSRFTNGDYSPDCVYVKGNPEEMGQPDPDYGRQSQLVVGQNLTFTCPAVYTNDAEDVAATCRGWTFALTNGTETSGSELSKKITYATGMAGATLAWNWDVEYKVKSAPEVTVSSPWAAAGSVVTLTAVPPTGQEVRYWTNTASSVTYSGNPIKVQVLGPMTLLPVYGRVRYAAVGAT